MSFDAALYQRILDNRHDDSPRLTYADWLVSQGDANLGELIRVQCALGQSSIDDPRRIILEAYEEALLTCVNMHSYLQDIGNGLSRSIPKFDGRRWRSLDFRSGFPDYFQFLDPEDVCRLTDLFDIVPIANVYIPNAYGHSFQAMLDFLSSRRISGLAIGDIYEKEIAQLASWPGLRNISRLTCFETNIPRLIEAVSQSPFAITLACFKAIGHPWSALEGQYSYGCVPVSPNLKRLRTLDVSNTVGSHDVLSLAASPMAHQLISLRLKGHDRGIPSLIRPESFSSLKALSLTIYGAPNSMYSDLMESNLVATLARLHVTGKRDENGHRESIISRLARNLSPRMIDLQLNGVMNSDGFASLLNGDDVALLSRSEYASGLRKLDLRRNYINMKGLECLTSASCLEELVWLCIGNSTLFPRQAAPETTTLCRLLAATTALPRLVRLDLNDRLDESDGQLLLKSSHRDELKIIGVHAEWFHEQNAIGWSEWSTSFRSAFLKRFWVVPVESRSFSRLLFGMLD